jgi:hypothetical protein
MIIYIYNNNIYIDSPSSIFHWENDSIIDSQSPGNPGAFGSGLKPFQDDSPTWEKPIPRVAVSGAWLWALWAVAKKHAKCGQYPYK